MELYRYQDKPSAVVTKLDPVKDIIGWISSLKSQGYVSEILRLKHGFTKIDEINNAARAISAHVDTAIQLLEQGYTSSVELSYLPTYYAMLDLAKCMIIFSGKLEELLSRQHRQHGATWSAERISKGLLTDEITLKTNGAIPLFYQTLVGKMWLPT